MHCRRQLSTGRRELLFRCIWIWKEYPDVEPAYPDVESPYPDVEPRADCVRRDRTLANTRVRNQKKLLRPCHNQIRFALFFIIIRNIRRNSAFEQRCGGWPLPTLRTVVDFFTSHVAQAPGSASARPERRQSTAHDLSKETAPCRSDARQSGNVYPRSGQC
jgi:hypothetical protein